MTNRPLVVPADLNSDDRGGPSADQEFFWTQFPVAAGSSHTKDVKNGSVPSLHGTQNEEGTMKHNWSARCQYNATGWGSMWAYDM